MRVLALTLLLAAVSVAQAQAPVTILTSSLPGGRVGVTYSAILSASGGVPGYTWSVSGSLPPGISLLPNGVLSGTPTVAGTTTIVVRAADTYLSGATRSLTIVVAPSATPSKPTIASGNLTAGMVGQPYNATLSATGGTQPYQWTVSQGALPAGLTLNRSLGTITGTPTAPGSANFQIQVTDAAQQSSTGAFTLTVNAPPLTLTTVSPLFTGTVGLPYAQTFSTSGGTQPLTWSILSGDPGGLKLGATSGVLQGTPQNAGTFPFTVKVADAAGVSVTQSYTVTINAPTLTVTLAGQAVSGAVGVPYNAKLPLVVGGGVAPFVWTLLSGSVPGLLFEPTTLNLSGTPTASGTFNLTIQARDAGGLTASRTIPIVIAPAALSIASDQRLPGVDLNDSYSYTMTAGGGSPPYTWSATGLPAGLSIDPSTGEISGIASAAGSFSLVIIVRDSSLAVAQNLFTIAVRLPAPPSIRLSGLPGIIGARQQVPLDLAVGSVYPAPISGTALLTFTPETGLPDRTVVFASGATSINFTIPAGSTTPQFDSPLMLQTGTVAGAITVTVSIKAGNLDITPTPAPSVTTQVLREAPAISDVQFSRSTGGIAITVTGYSTSREITRAVFAFAAASGQTLETSASSISVDVSSIFNNWYQNAATTQYGSQFVLTQPFTVQGDANAVVPVSVTLTNRDGSTTVQIKP